MMPPRNDIPPHTSWPSRTPLRRVIYAPNGFRAWPITLPAAFGASADGKKTSDWMNLAKPYPVGLALFSLPACELSIEHVGSLESRAEFWGPAVYLTGAGDPDGGTGSDGDYYLNLTAMEYWGPKGDDTEGSWENTGPTSLPYGNWLFGGGAPADTLGDSGDYYFDSKNHAWYGPKGATSWDGTGPTALPDPGDALISEPSLQTLSIPQPTPTAYGIGSTGSTTGPNSLTDDTGTYYSDWSNLSAPIPAGSGKLFAIHTYMGVNPLSPFFTTPPYTHHVTYTAYLELGDAGSNVLATVEVATHTFAYGTYPAFTQSVSAAFQSGQSVSLSAVATKKRAKMVVPSNHICGPFCNIQAGGYVEML